MNDSTTSPLTVRDRCPSCGSTAMEPLASVSFDQPLIRDFLTSHYEGRADLRRLTGARFEVCRCSRCHLVFQRTVPAGALLTEIYERWMSPSSYDRHRSKYALRMHRQLSGQVDLLVQHFACPPSQINVLDFGLGWSEWARVALSFGCNVAGAELAKDRCDYARSIGVEVLDWEEIPRHQFHFINTEQVFEHLIEPRETLRHLTRALRRDGLLKISVPNGHRIVRHVRRLAGLPHWPANELMPIQPLEHVNCFEYESLVELGRLAGLRPYRPPLRQVYNGLSGWFEPREGIRNILRPIYRHVFPKSTFVYFARAE